MDRTNVHGRLDSICHRHALYWSLECIAAEPVRLPAACRRWASIWGTTF